MPFVLRNVFKTEISYPPKNMICLHFLRRTFSSEKPEELNQFYCTFDYVISTANLIVAGLKIKTKNAKHCLLLFWQLPTTD